jgi:hypothetical protein
METILAIHGSVNHTIPLLRFLNLESLFMKMEAWFSETLNFGHTHYIDLFDLAILLSRISFLLNQTCNAELQILL